ncbi:MAG: HD domain-containing protein [Candidatus Protochlamydia sp.]|nr:HD domain-containing protein [Candidatus Protochlamydia sp.]
MNFSIFKVSNNNLILNGSCNYTEEIKFNLSNDISFLSQKNFVSIQEVAELSKNKKIYKKLFKTDSFYIDFKNLLKELRDKKFPFRVVDQVNKELKTLGRIGRGATEDFDDKLPTYFKTDVYLPEARKNLVDNFESELLIKGSGLEDSLALAEKTLWFHGTNSSILTLLPYTSFQIIPTGRLLDMGLAPMSGEINLGGMNVGAVNQTAISTDTIRNFARCWKYATSTSQSFYPSNQFTYLLQTLKTLSPDNDRWDPTIIDLIRLKQWQPEIFNEMTQKFANEIQDVKRQCLEQQCYLESLFLKALEFNIEELKNLNENEIHEKIVEAFPKFNIIYIDLFQDNPLSNLHRNLDNFKCPKAHWKSIIVQILRARAAGDAELLLLKKYALPDNIDEEDSLARKAHSKKNGITPRAVSDATYLLRDLKKVIPNNAELTAENVVKFLIQKEVDALIQKKMRPCKKRYERLLSLFDTAPKINFTEKERSLITQSFPLMFSSTCFKSYCRGTTSEFFLSKAALGKEIDLIFVDDKNIPFIQEWLVEHHLENSVTIKDIAILKKLDDFPLYHSNSQVMSLTPCVDSSDHLALNQIILKHALPLYQVPYPNGEKRVHHGVLHAVRTYFFALTLAELYREKGIPLPKDIKPCLLSATLHDCARQNDGIDLWDKESGEKCKKVLCHDLPENSYTKINRLPENLGDHYSRCIAEKDSKDIFSVEQTIIHDADCIEIMRCLNSPEDFKVDELWAMKDLDEETVFALIKEAQDFIKLTEQGTIKAALEASENPVALLYQILVFSFNYLNKFSMLMLIHGATKESFVYQTEHLLNAEVESQICNFFESL